MTRRLMGILGLLLPMAACSAALPVQSWLGGGETKATPTSTSAIFDGAVLQPPTAAGCQQRGCVSDPIGHGSAGSQSAPVGATPSNNTVPSASAFFKAANDQTRTPPPAPQNQPPGTPTLASFFAPSELRATSAPVALATARVRPSPIPGAPLAGTPGAAATPQGNSPSLEVAIYSGALAAGWSLENSWGVKVEADVNAVQHEGKNSIRVTPSEDYGTIFFSVSAAGKPNPRSKILSVNFWINPGDLTIRPDQLAVTVMGSNKYSYWLIGDSTVAALENRPSFSETRLSELNINRSLPVNTWTEVIVWLDKLVYDPDYQYVTGFYIKADQGFRDAFYVADLVLVEIP